MSVLLHDFTRRKQAALPLKSLFLTLLLIPLHSFSQSSHRDLASELIKDMQRAISDSTRMAQAKFQLYFTGDSPACEYLNASVQRGSEAEYVEESVRPDSVKVEVVAMSLVINRKLSETTRNSAYLRQLDLNVRFFWKQAEHQWRGSVSDELSKSSLKQLLNEDFPVRIRGNYLEDQPAFRLVVLTTLGVFSLVAALFFMRT